MKPRNYWSTFLMIAACTMLPFALLWSILFSIFMDLHLLDILPLGIIGGIAFGMIFGFIMAFYLQEKRIYVQLQDDSPASKIADALAKIGYYPGAQTDNMHTYKPSWKLGLLAGEISIEINNNVLTIIGPSFYANKAYQKLTQ
jgi:hypothetical protein